jgi:hypothetical protein
MTRPLRAAIGPRQALTFAAGGLLLLYGILGLVGVSVSTPVLVGIGAVALCVVGVALVRMWRTLYDAETFVE